MIHTCVGSETTWVRLKDDTMDRSLKYREVEGTKKICIEIANQEETR